MRGTANDVDRVELVRDKIVMQDERVRYTFEQCNDGIIGKIVLPSFYESGVNSSCEKDMREALRGLKKEGDLKGIVIDMRDNSGGFLSQAVKLSGLFITSGVVVISKYSRGEMQYLRDVDGRSYYDGPIVLLTSKASASAAEIVAQALQDYGVAVVVGDERTYGKGTIQYQTVTDDHADNFFKVTVGRYYTVSGRSTQIEGVKADIVVPTEYHPYNIGERFLAYPLKNDQVAPVYLDPLVDVDAKNKAWFQKNYLPNIQKKLSLWTRMLPELKEMSQSRVAANKSFVKYVKGSGDMSYSNEGDSESVNSDPQMNEAVLIVKDMIHLQQESFSSAN
jgi:carboxyl-terminal processing protease